MQTGGEIEIETPIESAFQVGSYRSGLKYSRVILVKFPSWDIKNRILKAHRDTPDFVEGVSVGIYADLSVLTLKKRRSFQLLMSVLQRQKIPYRWDFPFRLIVTHNSKVSVLQSISEAKRF